MTASPSDAQDGTAPEQAVATDELPLRVSTLEIFFDLVFAFTLTQLTDGTAHRRARRGRRRADPKRCGRIGG